MFKILIAVCMCLMLAACASTGDGAAWQNINGQWVIDIEASTAINPHLAQSESYREDMSLISMEINMREHTLTPLIPEEKIQPLAFTVLEQSGDSMLLRFSIDDTTYNGRFHVNVNMLPGNKLEFRVVEDKDGREHFIFIKR